MGRGRWLVVLGAAVLGAGGATACRPPGVRLAFAPPLGTILRYRAHVVSTLSVTVPGAPVSTTKAVRDIMATEVLIGRQGSVSIVLVQLFPAAPVTSGQPVTLRARIDRQASLVGLEEAGPGGGGPGANGAPAGLALQGVVPAALGAPADRPLATGSGWDINSGLVLQGLAPARVHGRGRLVALGVRNGERVAVSRVRAVLDVAPDGALESPALRGHEMTSATVTRTLRDGAVARATSVASGRFELLDLARAGTPVIARIDVEVRTTSTRLA